MLSYEVVFRGCPSVLGYRRLPVIDLPVWEINGEQIVPEYKLRSWFSNSNLHNLEIQKRNAWFEIL